MNTKKITGVVFLIGISAVVLPSASGIFESKTNLELYLESDLIVMVQVLSLSELKEDSNTTPRTVYEISILQNIMGNTETNNITVVGFGALNSTLRQDNQTILSEGQQVLLVLNRLSDGYFYISPYSNYSDTINPDLHFILPPLKLFKAGVSVDDIHCKSNLELAFKASNDFPICIKPQTSDQLLRRGWIK